MKRLLIFVFAVVLINNISYSQMKGKPKGNNGEFKDEKKIEINTTELVEPIKRDWESPKNLFLIDDFNRSIIIRAEAKYDRSDGLNEEEINWVNNIDLLQWWVLPI